MARCASFVYPGSVWWRCFAVWWRHRLPYTTPSTKTNDKSQRSSLIWQFSNKECLLRQKRPKDCRGNTSNLTKQVTVHHSRNINVMINFHRGTRPRLRGLRRNANDPRTCSIEIFNNEQAVDILLVEANRHRLPNLLLWPQRQEVTYTM